jgi:hypothetical protein
MSDVHLTALPYRHAIPEFIIAGDDNRLTRFQAADDFYPLVTLQAGGDRRAVAAAIHYPEDKSALIIL